MSERTPQDVLREEAAWVVAATRITKEHGQLCPVWTQRMKRAEKPWQEAIAGCNCWIIKEARTTVRILEEHGWRLDKAIAEAPDSPPKSYWMEFLAWEEQAAKAGSGMTAEQKQGAAMFRSWLVNQGPDDNWPEASDTLSEKPGLDVERLAEALFGMGNQLKNVLNGEAAEIEHVLAEEIAFEYARLGEGSVDEP